ncbi:MAG: sugar phosphate isomerase/epimerase, partial [Zetaproteobacteria bacterium]
MDRIVSVSTMAFDGYTLETALDELAALGVRCVEPASVDKIFQHLVEEDFCDARAAWLRDQLAARRLACLSLSVHMDLTGPDAVERFHRRLQFARNIGARCVNSIAGPTGKEEAFKRNIPAIADRARDLGVVIALENHGDLLDCGQQVLEFIREVDHPAVRVNYDTGNAWYYSKGTIDPVEELAQIAPVVAHVHVKTPKIVDGLLRWVALGDGILDLPVMGRVLKERLPGVPVSYELSPRQRSRDFEPRWRTPEIPSL